MQTTVTVTGTVEHISTEEPIKEGSSTTKQTAVVKVPGQYDQYISVNFMNGRCGRELSEKKFNDAITIHVNLEGRKYEKDGKTSYFNDIKGWKVE